MTRRNINDLIAERDAKLAAASDQELIEARERADAGIRAAMPRFVESLDRSGTTPAPSADPVSAKAIQRIGKRFPLADKQVHLHINGMLNQSRDMGAYHRGADRQPLETGKAA